MRLKNYQVPNLENRNIHYDFFLPNERLCNQFRYNLFLLYQGQMQPINLFQKLNPNNCFVLEGRLRMSFKHNSFIHWDAQRYIAIIL